MNQRRALTWFEVMNASPIRNVATCAVCSQFTISAVFDEHLLHVVVHPPDARVVTGGRVMRRRRQERHRAATLPLRHLRVMLGKRDHRGHARRVVHRPFEEGVGMRHDDDVLVGCAGQHAPDVRSSSGRSAVSTARRNAVFGDSPRSIIWRIAVPSWLPSMKIGIRAASVVPPAVGSFITLPGKPSDDDRAAAPASSARFTVPKVSAVFPRPPGFGNPYTIDALPRHVRPWKSAAVPMPTQTGSSSDLAVGADRVDTAGTRSSTRPSCRRRCRDFP